jgi:hypothetical protein
LKKRKEPKGKQRSGSARSRKRPTAGARKPSQKQDRRRSERRKTPKVSLKKPKLTASVSRATTPARSTHSIAAAAAKIVRSAPLQSPLPLRHIAPPRPVLVAPARSMPPVKEAIGKPVIQTTRGPLVAPEFADAGILLAITYSIREGRRGEFFDLMRELKPLLSAIGGTDCTVYEDRSRPNYFMEVFRFKDEAEFTAFDDKFHKDRKIAAIYALLDDIVEAEKSDFKIFERRL